MSPVKAKEGFRLPFKHFADLSIDSSCISSLSAVLAYSVMSSCAVLAGTLQFSFDGRNLFHFSEKYPKIFCLAGSVDTSEKRYSNT